MRPNLRIPSMGERLADQLRNKIVRGELTAGTHLVEDTLAETYDVSRGPVRDAFKILSAEGLLSDRRRGFFIRGFSRADVEELFSLRLSMETLAMELASEITGADGWDEPQAKLDAMYDAADAGDWHSFAQHDLAFHGTFYTLSGHARLQSLWQQYKPLFGTMLDITNEKGMDRTWADDHLALLDLARLQQLPAMRIHLKEHLADSKERMIIALEPVWAQSEASSALLTP